jgi:glycosyltransferase involved in cell wall biosynthesis
MKVLIFANKMPDLCGAFLHDIDLASELVRRGHMVVFLTIKFPREGVNGGTYRGFRFLHYSAASSFLDTSDIWLCPHAPILPDVRGLNTRGYFRPIVATCHYDGNYTMITRNSEPKWSEMLLFINNIMEVNYRKNISPWPSQIAKTDVVRPILHREKILISEPFQGEYITLVNANENKGVHQFLELARRLPQRKFLGILPYYGNIRIPTSPPPNIRWISFADDIREVLKETRILLMPSYYESYGRIGMEAMLNGIPVIYSRPAKKSPYPGGSTEGMLVWTGDVAIACERDVPEEWIAAIESLDNPDTYADISERSRIKIESMNPFEEGQRIAEMIESFSRSHPVVPRQTFAPAKSSQQQSGPVMLMPREPKGPVGFGFSNGRLRIQR